MQRKNDLTGKPTLMKELNIGLIKDALAKNQTATRVELSAMTQISQPTVNVLIRQLLEEEVVVSLGMAKSTGGRKAEVYALNTGRNRILSVIAESRGFRYVLTNLELKEEARGEIICDPKKSYKEQLCSFIKKILQENKYIEALVVGVPGAVTSSGEVFDIPQIPEWEHFRLEDFLEQELVIPVKVMNDINATAVGYAGSALARLKNMVYLYLGNPGIGAGIIVDGKLYSGCKSFSGEIGHMRLDGNDTVEKQLEGNPNEAARTELFEKIVTNFICILNPEKIVIGGEVSKEMYEAIRNGCQKQLPSEILPEFEWIQPGQAERYYIAGLGETGKELLDQEVRLA